VEAMLSAISSMPDVRDGAVASQGAELGIGTVGLVHAITGNPTRPGILAPAHHHAVSPGYFGAMGVRVVGGREFTRADRSYRPGVVVVNEAFAHRFYPGLNPVGRYLHLGRMSLEPEWYQVVGVVSDVRAHGLGVSAQPPAPAIYFSALQVPPHSLLVTARAAGNPLDLAEAMERALRFVEPAQRVIAARPLTEVLADAAAPLRWAGWVFAAISLFGLVLAGAGVYGVIAFSVSRRTREIGIRIALGADPATVVRMVLRDAVRLAASGLLAGLAGALCLARLLQYLFHGLDPLDPLVYLPVMLVLGATAVIAGLAPARAAAALHPAVALREE